MKSGETIRKEDIFPLRPLKKGCVYPYQIDEIVGKKLKKSVKEDTCLLWEMIEND